MRKLLVLSFIAGLLGSLAVVACVSDSPATPTPDAPQGALDGPCFATNECNAGLSCSVVNGAAKCVADGGTGTGWSSSSSSSSGSVLPDGSVDPLDSGADSGDAEAGTAVCTVSSTLYPCGGTDPPNTCFGATQSCTLTGCNTGEILWSCNSAKDCGSGYVCCIPTTAATAKPAASCAIGSLELVDGAGLGTSCTLATVCPVDNTQLCQIDADCPPNQHCTGIKVGGGGAAINGLSLGVCAP